MATPVSFTPSDVSAIRYHRDNSIVMSESRAGATHSNALSFARILVRKAQAEGWKISLKRLDIDVHGAGEALYQILTPTHIFHYYIISNHFPDDQKVDRPFGINWDVSAALIEGEWQADREAVLREEIPKQYDGRFDTDTHCFCRGNRSERLFEQVVDCLAQGIQPPVSEIMNVGYLLRSTAFAANGLFGMRPFCQLPASHPLSGTYAAQMLAAYLLRDFMGTLVDTMARLRNPDAVPLDLNLRRYLGIGNSAGLGVIPFITNHPELVQHWISTEEDAVAAAKAMSFDTDSDPWRQFIRLLHKAYEYFHHDISRPALLNESAAQIAADLAQIKNNIQHIENEGATVETWGDLIATIVPDACCAHTHEALNGLLLELFPKIISQYETQLSTTEHSDFSATMTIKELNAILNLQYQWFTDTAVNGGMEYFWYLPQESPFEPRRGIRGVRPELERETSSDLPLKIKQLKEILTGLPITTTVGEFVAEHPELLATVARVQTMGTRPYGEMHINALNAEFTPFSASRLILSWYGMEKFAIKHPRSTRGALMQGAPLIDELHKSAGDWPFPAPLVPTSCTASSVSTVEVSNVVARHIPQSVAPALLSDDVTIFWQEIEKYFKRYASSASLDMGTTDILAKLIHASLAIPLDRLEDFVERYTGVANDQNEKALMGQLGNAILTLIRIIGTGKTTAPVTFDEINQENPILSCLPIVGSGQGHITAICNLERRETSLSGPGPNGPWWMKLTGYVPAWKQSNEQDSQSWMEQLLKPTESVHQAGIALFTCAIPAEIDGSASEAITKSWFTKCASSDDLFIDSRTWTDVLQAYRCTPQKTTIEVVGALRQLADRVLIDPDTEALLDPLNVRL